MTQEPGKEPDSWENVPHASIHGVQAMNARTELQDLREKLGFSSRLQVEIQVACPEDLPNAYGTISWDYLPYQQFYLKFRCDLAPDERRWIVCHELLEAVMAPYAEFTDELIHELKGARAQLSARVRHAELRDGIIEQLCYSLLGEHRPLTLTPHSKTRIRSASSPSPLSLGG